MGEKASRWPGDVLDRHEVGDFLSKVLRQRYAAYHGAPGTGALCVALDADWGIGKTFFVERWSADLLQAGHPVVHFDAWLNDLTDDPLLGFMASLDSELKPWISKLPVSTAVRRSAGAKFKKVVRAASKAALPAVAALGKGLLRAGTGIDLNGISAGMSDELEGSLKEAGTKAVEKFFEEALRSHQQKREAIAALKNSLEELAAYLGEQNEVSLPLFIFIDELDRCRPDYAIRLLEGVKHLFDAHGLCFVFSTNLRQLAASAKAVYGESFDSSRYLKRFFTFEYHLPLPSAARYADLLVAESIFVRKAFASTVSVMPDSSNTSVAKRVAHDFALVAQTFKLDLRTQKQVFRHAEVVASYLEESEVFYPFYLFFLASLHNVSIDIIDAMATGSGARLKELDLQQVSVAYRVFSEDRHRQDHTSTLALFNLFFERSKWKASDLVDESINKYEYPKSILIPLQTESRRSGSNAPLSISKYLRGIRAAGQFS